MLREPTLQGPEGTPEAGKVRPCSLCCTKPVSDLALAHCSHALFSHRLRGRRNGRSLHFADDLTLVSQSVSHSSSITASIYRWESVLEWPVWPL